MLSFRKKYKNRAFEVVEEISMISKRTNRKYKIFIAASEGEWFAMTEPKKFLWWQRRPDIFIQAEDQEDAEIKAMAVMNILIDKDDENVSRFGDSCY